VLFAVDDDFRSCGRVDVVPHTFGLGHGHLAANTLAHRMLEIGEAAHANLSLKGERSDLCHLSTVVGAAEELEGDPPGESIAVVILKLEGGHVDRSPQGWRDLILHVAEPPLPRVGDGPVWKDNGVEILNNRCVGYRHLPPTTGVEVQLNDAPVGVSEAAQM
jgi:hypothetical protein